MKENAIKKINTVGKVGRILTNIGMVIAIIALVLSLLGSVILAFFPKNLITYDITETTKTDAIVDYMALAEKVSGEKKEEIINKLNEKYDEIITADGKELENGYLAVDENGHIRFTMTEEDNHTLDVISATVPIMVVVDLTMAFALVALVFAKKLCGFFEKCNSPFEDGVISAMCKFAVSLVPWVILNGITENTMTSFMYGKPQVDFVIDFSTIAVVLVIFALTLIFRYGAILQKESDETL